MKSYLPSFEATIGEATHNAARAIYPSNVPHYDIRRYGAVRDGSQRIERLEAILMRLEMQVLAGATEEHIERQWAKFEQIEGEI
ncbi:MAG TPA: hypothetical protein VLG47_01770 [Candidatus Saccharimonadales bacterium]|nr:hypothetical protein [Candidatus Saccharimonadales bacterium]